MQKRLLSDSLLNIHRKFLTENPDKMISYSLFCKLRPFWVVHPSLEDRDTCLCKTHENLEFMAIKLHDVAILQTRNIEQLADNISCDPKSKSCMYGECQTCRDSIPEINDFGQEDEVIYTQWRTVAEPLPTDKERTFNITTKVKEKATKQILLERFQSSLTKFRRHLYTIRHQFSSCRELRRRLSPSECVIHIDFSENFSGKFGSEIQSVHFGGSHKQVTLHTVVLYVGDVEQPIPLCTVSPSKRHDPIAIWKYLEPLIDYMKESHRHIEVLHFFSDGPTTQYRQNINFFLFCTKIFDIGYQALPGTSGRLVMGRALPTVSEGPSNERPTN